MATTIDTPIRNVYGTGVDLQNAKNSLGATGGKFNYIDTGKPGYTGASSYTSSDIVLGGVGTIGGVSGDIGSATRLAGTNATETASRIAQWAQPLSYVDQVNNAVNQAQANRAPLPTYDANADINSINQSYADQQQALITRLQGQTDTAVANLNYQTASARPQYQQARNQVDVNYNQQQQKSTEQLASQGLNKSGKNLTSSAILGASRVNALGALTAQEQKMVDDANFQINQLKASGATEQNAQILELNAKKNDALTQAKQRNFDNQLQLFNTSAQISQQDLTNMINGIQFAYGVTKDQAQSVFQNQQFDYQKAQDLADRQFKQAQFDYQKATDKINQAFQERQITNQEKQQALDNAYRDKQASEATSARLASAAKTSASSSNTQAKYTESDINNKMWAQFYDAQSKGVGSQWLKDNMKNILNSGSSTANAIYQGMVVAQNNYKPTATTNNGATTPPAPANYHIDPLTGAKVSNTANKGGYLGSVIDWIFGK